MKAFIDKDFLLGSETAKVLYHKYAAAMPIIDYHCHVKPAEIAEDRQYKNISQLWLESDHYKWRIMRWRGVDERYITGDSSDWEKFEAFANALAHAPGNPLYHWTHLELQRYFDCYFPLGPNTAKDIWRICNEKLNNGYSVRDIINRSGVEVICTTDDPASDLVWHEKIARDKCFSTKVYPTFRPDKALAVNKPGYADYIHTLSDAFGRQVLTLDDLFDALVSRLEYFTKYGCKVADHALDVVPWDPVGGNNASIFKRAMSGEIISAQETERFQTELMLFLGREYAKRGIVMQLHYGALRNVNPVLFRLLGHDSGLDCIGSPDCSRNLAAYLGSLEDGNVLPKTLLYSINPNDNAMLVSLAGTFQQAGVVGKVQSGSVWWYNDAKSGIESHITTLSEMAALGCFIGMLTDSRSFLSYTRHEYFRRILCGLLGNWVENGEYSDDIDWLGSLVQNISYNNAKMYFDFSSQP